jgi:MFS family permease
MSARRNIPLLSWFNFLIDFVFFAPIAVLYFAHVTGSYALGMSVFAVIHVSSAVFEVPTGVFSDIIGRRNTVVAGAIASLLSVVCYAIGGTYAMLIVGALLEGMGRSFYSGNNDAMLHDTLAETKAQDDYHRHFGRLNGFNALGSAVVAITGSIMASVSFSLVLWISLIPRVILVILALYMVEPSVHLEKSTNIYVHLKESLEQFRTNRKLRLLTIVSAMRNAVYEGAYTFRTAFVATLWPLWAIGISNTISNLGAALSFFYSGRIIDRFGYKNVLVFEIIINRIINVTALVFPTVASPALMGVTSLTYGVTTTAVNALLQKEFTTKQRATLGSLSSFFGSIAFGVAVVLLGYIGDRIGPANALIIAHISILSILFFYQKIFSKKSA